MPTFNAFRTLALVTVIAFFCFRPAAAQTAIPIQSFDDLTRALDAISSTTDAAQSNALADNLWQSLKSEGRIPFIDGTQVAFLYHGAAKAVDWIGEWNAWGDSGRLHGKQVGQSDLWLATATFPLDGRLDYRIDVDFNTPIVDPGNPHQDVIPAGTVSVFAMPDYHPVKDTHLDPSVPRGAITDDIRIRSTGLAYTLAYRVYTPVGYEKLDALPTIYVLDGQKFVDDRIGAMRIVLDNLIAHGQMQPAIAVFIDTRNPDHPDSDRRQSQYGNNPVYGQFLADELVPAIDQTYHTSRDPKARVLLGISSSGVATVMIGFNHSDIFHNVAAFSPSMYEIPQLEQLYKKADPLPLKFFIVVGNPRWEDGDARPFIEELLGKSYDLHVIEVPGQGHSWHLWTDNLPAMLTAFLPPA